MDKLIWNGDLAEGIIVSGAKCLGCDINTRPELGFGFRSIYFEPDVGNLFKALAGGAYVPLTSEEMDGIRDYIAGFEFPDEPVHVIDSDGLYRGLLDATRMEEGDKAVPTAPPSGGHIWRNGEWRQVKVAVRDDGTWDLQPAALDIFALYFTEEELSEAPRMGFKWDFVKEAFYDARDIEKVRYMKATDIRNAYEAKNWQAWGKFIPAYERETWRIQESEALAFKADPSTPTPFIDKLVEIRVDVTDKVAYVEEILANAQAFKATLATSLGEEFNLLSQVGKAGSLAELDAIQVPEVVPRW